ncbi:hypothetical protein [Paenibacillus ihbetae]|uniref:hypothetical protein n=1 Tax=Paenibacillus ihbetae TaxID=1870820 RepID=UPI000F749C46|nr:hypothetical protein [Paenibacillus ihbetae]
MLGWLPRYGSPAGAASGARARAGAADPGKGQSGLHDPDWSLPHPASSTLAWRLSASAVWGEGPGPLEGIPRGSNSRACLGRRFGLRLRPRKAKRSGYAPDRARDKPSGLRLRRQPVSFRASPTGCIKEGAGTALSGRVLVEKASLLHLSLTAGGGGLLFLVGLAPSVRLPCRGCLGGQSKSRVLRIPARGSRGYTTPTGACPTRPPPP